MRNVPLKYIQSEGLKPTKLSDCCRTMKIQLNHHEALSDARACPIVFAEVVLRFN
jgi:DNA polymerase III epsilon subunit-like protein